MDQRARDLVLVVDEVPGPGGSANVRGRREPLGGDGGDIAVGPTRALQRDLDRVRAAQLTDEPTGSRA